jgi:hypothetical protein
LGIAANERVQSGILHGNAPADYLRAGCDHHLQAVKLKEKAAQSGSC